MPVLPMFPLGSVLFPHMVLPLHIFEPRYRALIEDLTADGATPEFGVVLINRGHEVGGGDLRTDVGTVARVIQTEPLEDGRWLAIAVGTRRFRVERWLEDAPYPRAEVVDLPEPARLDADGRARAHDRLVPQLRRLLALQSELGEDTVPSTFDVVEEVEVLPWQLAVLAPLSALDAQRVLVAADHTERLDRLGEAFTSLEEGLTFRLGDPG